MINSRGEAGVSRQNGARGRTRMSERKREGEDERELYIYIRMYIKAHKHDRTERRRKRDRREHTAYIGKFGLGPHALECGRSNHRRQSR